ncbi:MAG TPA: DUF5715 family protein [Thermoanaerobaculia bacterium]|nr:DUF5715 family protein [Thermoanaerobaculia bacterium]
MLRPIAAGSLFLLVLTAGADGATLRGSRSSLLRQQKLAKQHDYSTLRTRAEVRKFVRAGRLVTIPSGGDLELANVAFPYARPELRVFLERLAGDYRRATGETLVVTSLTRPLSHQPRNASFLSVHPTGMAVDLRRSRSAGARRWLEARLLTLEREGVLEATRESRPPHYHVALFPAQYGRFVADGGLPKASAKTYRVSRGDTLWGIARRVGSSVTAIKRANAMESTMLRPGQVLRLP